MNLIFLTTVYYLSIFLHIVALVIALAFVIPLQIKEARVKNGLKKLRKLMLMSGLTIIFLSVVSIIALSIPLVARGSEIARYISVTTVLLHSIGFLIFALIKRQIYREQYSTEQKEFHEEVAKLEDKKNGTL